jgi:glycosyltransferase involved in cell wall biosynthesis
MNIYLSYRYHPYTTGVYFEKAFKSFGYGVFYIGASSSWRPGFPQNMDITRLQDYGMPTPDLVLFIDSANLFPRGLEKLTCPSAIYLIDVHRDMEIRSSQADFFDYVFVAQRDYVPAFRDLGHAQVHWLPLACDPDVHGKRERETKYDVGFVGHLNSEDRKRRLRLLDERFILNDYGQFYPKEEIAEIYSQSKIVFNSSIGGDLNMRVFEALASGSLLVTDRIENGQSDLFEDRVHLVEYSDDQEMLEVIAYYLTHESERERIAQAGHDLVLDQHTYLHRCQQMLNMIFEQGKPKLGAKIRGLDPASTRKAYARIYRDYGMLDAVMDELNTAWRMKKGYWGVLGMLLGALAKTLNRIFRRTYTEKYQ